ncbi:thioesterase family protein [Shimia sp. CNT1-13L.2]|uniref:thioesterase family protein n=1 Tax=Shimia sp. CNT1-13L.2 TaxID=2959663 RepID=UPI0020CCEAB3|nr:thioesterase family protein [Shimia sp. CNT1-13L.2]MCP9482509.1 thioesterase family protein [Shimia sp. CNT1-13L.2]
MSETFFYETTVIPEWIDYNGHMQDAYYGLIFSYAVDALQNEIGFDETYRKSTGCTIYLLEDHKYFLREVKEGAKLRVETVVLDSDDKRFHLYLTMREGGEAVAIGETMELHVDQHPAPHAVAMPIEIAERLASAQVSCPNDLSFRSRSIKLGSPKLGND